MATKPPTSYQLYINAKNTEYQWDIHTILANTLQSSHSWKTPGHPRGLSEVQTINAGYEIQLRRP